MTRPFEQWQINQLAGASEVYGEDIAHELGLAAKQSDVLNFKQALIHVESAEVLLAQMRATLQTALDMERSNTNYDLVMAEPDFETIAFRKGLV